MYVRLRYDIPLVSHLHSYKLLLGDIFITRQCEHVSSLFFCIKSILGMTDIFQQCAVFSMLLLVFIEPWSNKNEYFVKYYYVYEIYT